MEIPPLELVLMAQRLAEKAFDMDNETAPLDFDAMKKKACLLLESEECNLDLEKVIIVDEAQVLELVPSVAIPKDSSFCFAATCTPSGFERM